VSLIEWAHHLTTHQRNGGDHLYGMLVLAWVVLIVVTLALWTVVALVIGSRVVFSKAILAAEAILAAFVFLAMVVMVGATAVWWAAMAKDAPSFLSQSPAGAHGSPWDVRLVATVVLMVFAMIVGAAGVLREGRVWRKMQLD
jgi:hypothetical protein